MAPHFSVILPTFNGAATIGQQLSSLAVQRPGFDWEVLVVNNASSDSTVAVATEYVGRLPLRIVDAPERHNLSYVRNVGVHNSQATFVAFCDDDDRVAADWLAELAAATATHPFVASKMCYDEINDGGNGVIGGRFQSDRIEMFFGRPVVNGAIAIRRDLWDAVGGNREEYARSGEDFDFALRVGSVCGVQPHLSNAMYHYRQRAGAGAALRQGMRFGEAHVHLYVDHIAASGVRPDVALARREWWWIISRLPVASARHRRAVWCRKLGLRAGRLLGSVRYRRWCP